MLNAHAVFAPIREFHLRFSSCKSVYTAYIPCTFGYLQIKFAACNVFEHKYIATYMLKIDLFQTKFKLDMIKLFMLFRDIKAFI